MNDLHLSPEWFFTGSQAPTSSLTVFYMAAAITGIFCSRTCCPMKRKYKKHARVGVFFCCLFVGQAIFHVGVGGGLQFVGKRGKRDCAVFAFEGSL